MSYFVLPILLLTNRAYPENTNLDTFVRMNSKFHAFVVDLHIT